MKRRYPMRMLAGMAMVWALAGVAGAQVRQLNTSNMMDANPGVGTGGANQGVQGYVPVNGNDIMTGNVSGLQYFHGPVSITSPYAFQAALGTSNLSSFARQSAGNGIGGSLNQVYFLPSATVSSAQGGIYSAPIGGGFDSNLVPRTSVSPIASAAQIQAWDPGAATSSGAAFNRTAAEAGLSDVGTAGTVLSSPIFVMRDMELSPSPGDQSSKLPDTVVVPGATNMKSDQNSTTNDQSTSDSGTPDPRIAGPIGAPLNPLVNSAKDTRISGSYQALMDELNKAEADENAKSSDGGTSSAAGGPGSAAGTKGKSTNVAADNIDPLTGAPRRRTLLPKTGATSQPNSQGMGSQLMAEEDQKKDAMPAKSLEDLPASTLQAGGRIKPMSTLVRVPVNGKSTPVDVLMTQAEKLLKGGKYLEAAEIYQTALAREPGNALALVGRAHAELGAGMYQSAAYDLKYVYTRNPQMISVRYQMDQFIPTARQDYLVSDLKTLAASKESGNTASFLLSYLYYQTGSRQQMQAELARWNGRTGHDAWQAVVSKAWADQDAH